MAGHRGSPDMFDLLSALFWYKLVKSIKTIRKYVGVAIVIATFFESLLRASLVLSTALRSQP